MRASLSESQPIVFDSEGFSRAIRKDAYMQAVLTKAFRSGLPVMVSAATIVEVMHPKMNLAAYDWTRSQLDVIPVSEDIAVKAARLLGAAHFHGHKHALDALVVATSLELGGHPTIFTSDPDDIKRLAGKSASIVTLR